GSATVVCCHYDEAGSPVWHQAGPAPFTEGRMEAPAGGMASVEDSAARQSALRLTFAAEHEALVEWADVAMKLSPQHAQSPGWSGTGASGIGGSWIEEAARPLLRLVIEDLGNRIFAAALLDDGWWMTVATRGHADSFAGEWLRFHGGQSLGGPYRAPTAPHTLGQSRMMRVPTDRLVVQVPDGTHRLLRRADSSAAGP